MVNRERKKCKSEYYMTHVHNTEKGNPKAWWNEIKCLGGMKSTNSSIIHQINIDGSEDNGGTPIGQQDKYISP